eukprot:4970716-Pyramimonas_sp.AAC.1
MLNRALRAERVAYPNAHPLGSPATPIIIIIGNASLHQPGCPEPRAAPTRSPPVTISSPRGSLLAAHRIDTPTCTPVGLDTDIWLRTLLAG